MKDQIRIDFNKPTMIGTELEYITQAFSNSHISGDGIFTRKVQQLLETELGVPRVLTTTSCTHALEMSAILLDIKSGDEVIIPDFTFVSTVNAFVLRGAKPVFIDIRPDTLNMDESLLEGCITSRTRAVVPVHYAGVACEMDAILRISRKFDLHIIEDNAHGLFGMYRNRPLGTFGDLAAQSFHETKNISCGEGGALLINNHSMIDRAEIIREKGTNRSRFFRGMVDKYSWVDIGSSYLPSDILAAVLFAQLEARQTIQQQRSRIWEYYQAHLSSWAKKNSVQLPFVPEYCDQAFHMFYLLLPSYEVRQALISHLKRKGIVAVFHYLPLHTSEMGRKFGGRPGMFPVTEMISDRLLRLPFYNSLSQDEQDEVISSIMEFQP